MVIIAAQTLHDIHSNTSYIIQDTFIEIVFWCCVLLDGLDTAPRFNERFQIRQRY